MALAAAIVVAAALAISPIVPDPDGCDESRGRCVLIDGGAHLGETIEHFRRTRMGGRHRWEILAFEANPEMARQIAPEDGVTVLEQAIWTEDGELEFFLAEDTEGSSAFGDKVTGRLAAVPIRVPAVDFSRWLARSVAPEDWVIVKLDVEGAEYPVLEKVLHDRTGDRIDRLHVEFHNDKVGEAVARDQELIRALREQGVSVRIGRSSIAGDWFRDWISPLELVSGRRAKNPFAAWKTVL